MAPSGLRRYLAEGEVLVMEVRRHVTVLAQPVAVALAAIAGAVLVGWLTSPAEGSDPVDVAAGAVAVLSIARTAWRVWEWRVDRIVVTDRRIFQVSGLLTRKVASMPLAKVTDMTYRRSVPGRLLGYGELMVESAGQKQALHHIDHLPKPDHFYRTVTSLVTGRAYGGRAADEDTGPLPRVVL